MATDNGQASVWATSSECWDDFLNDSELAQEIDSVRKSADNNVPEDNSGELKTDDTVGDRLLAYETPITEEILRQLIK